MSRAETRLSEPTSVGGSNRVVRRWAWLRHPNQWSIVAKWRTIWRGILMAVILAGCSVPIGELERADGRPSPSPTPGYHAGRCVLNDVVRLRQDSLTRSFVGGRLAANVNAAGYIVQSVDKSIWAVRTNEPPSQIVLVRERLDAPAPTFELTGRPIQHGDDSGLPQWGPTYYVELRFPSTGCWRLRLHEGRPEDFIVFYVTAGPPSP